MIKIGSVVIDCENIYKMEPFWKELLHYISREPDPKDPCVVMKDSTGKGTNVTIDQMEPYRGRIH
jgi:hypothetical protein